ncbi:MAG: 2,3-bisphosphoglycerate-independent phosphoglycerate mutase, partial [Candidatus Delongbacteria bacterium]|nr:2,3-bisphosphoglycerate-independent phosphoglycerate mutase [Candidatus Delongbacteria bacterium]
LPEGQMGNSEVGHMSIGSGRVLYQDLVKISLALQENTLKDNPELVKLLKNKSKRFHLVGLMSDGGVHSHIEHLVGLAEIASDAGKEVFLHLITDGRDVSPTSAKLYLEQIDAHLSSSIKLATISGRFYAMDRDNRWERVKTAYDMLTMPKDGEDLTATKIIKNSYQNNITDEFIVPQNVIRNGKSIANIKHGDSVLFFNFRSDRARELSLALNSMDGVGFETSDLKLNFTTMTQYREDLPFKVISPKEHYQNILGKVISDKGLNQLRIAETEKYAHVTFFFNGGEDTVFENEERILVLSPNVATYDHQPEMSAFLVTEKLKDELEKDKHSLIVLNFANCDMVGHTGIYQAAIKAVETIDICIGEIYHIAEKMGYTIIITADHGNAEKMKDGEVPFTAHTKNKVPFLITSEKTKIKDGKLADIAPTILKLLEIKIPNDMTGSILMD